jgi:putative NADPH-quinone reductase
MPNFLLIVTHADTKGTGTAHTLAQAAQPALLAAGHDVRVVDLVNTAFNTCASPADFLSVPEGRFSYGALQQLDNLVPAIREQQANLEWATHVIVIGPIWFYRFPANFYAFQDRVLTTGWACSRAIKYEDLALYGKKVLFVITTGGSAELYSHGGPVTSIEAVLYPNSYTFQRCGFTVCRTQGIWEAGRGSPDEQKAVTEKFISALLNIDKRPTLKFADPAKPEGTDELQVFAELPNISLEEAAGF